MAWKGKITRATKNGKGDKNYSSRDYRISSGLLDESIFRWCVTCSEPFHFFDYSNYHYFVKYSHFEVLISHFGKVLTCFRLLVVHLGTLRVSDCSDGKSNTHVRPIFWPMSRSFDFFQGQGQVNMVKKDQLRSRSCKKVKVKCQGHCT